MAEALLLDPEDEDLRPGAWLMKSKGRPAGWVMSRAVERLHKYDSRLIHREVARRMGLKIGGLEVDHMDRNVSNNRRSNLRVATELQNRSNKSRYSNNWSGFKGVHLVKATGKYQARIQVGGKRISLGCFTTPLEAGRAYDQAAKQYHGEFASLNMR